MSSIRVLGLDVAAANSGACVLEVSYPDYSFEVLHEDGYKHPIKDFRNRIDIANELLSLALDYEVDLVVLEDYAMRFGKLNTSGYQHGEIGGMLRKELYEAGFCIYIIPPTTMRSFYGVPPKSDKTLLEERAEERYGFVSEASNKKKRSDATDAFLQGHIGCLLYLLKNHSLEYDLLPREERILYGDKTIEGLLDRSTIEYDPTEDKKAEV